MNYVAGSQSAEEEEGDKERMIENIIGLIMEGLAPVLAALIIIGLILVGTGAGIWYILTVTNAFEYHWLLGCVVAILLLLVYVLIASFVVGLFLV